jgi:hemerythrin-like domain-containing protein
MEFFTRRVGVHFKRETLLITTLRRFLNRNEGEGSQFQCLLEEHRKLKAQATAVMCRLPARGRETCRPPLSSSARRDEMESVARELRTFVRRYRAHLSCEERILFVLAEMRLAAEQKERLSFCMLQV